MTSRLCIIFGPTGVGKSSLALDLARQHGAEIVSADAGQVFRGFDIGTAKPSQEEQSRVPHHCLDLWAPDVRADAVMWARKADAAIADIQERGKKVIVVGGTGFYIKALLHGIFEGPDPDPEIRDRLTAEFDAGEGAAMHARLQAIDPEAAARIHATDPVRLIRALETYEQTGRTISDWQREHRFQKQRYDAVKFGLTEDRETLYERINQRTLAMMEDGWLDEARALHEKWGGQVPAFKMIGYREMREFFEGRRDEASLVPIIQQMSRRYAKRQLTWLRADSAMKALRLGDHQDIFSMIDFDSTD